MKKRKLHFTLGIFMMLSCYLSFAQQKQITGTVTDDQGMPLPGVNIIVEGSTTGTQTDFDGEYQIFAATEDILVFSYLGFQTQKIKVTAGVDTYNVTMKSGASELDEIVVVGYGTQSKRTLTDNIVKLSSEDIKEVPVSNFQSALVGKAAGVQITQTNGKVEGGLNIRVRGATSISAGTQPLYVLDGIPLYNENESSNGAPTNPLLSISPNEIESIEILKDASSAAIYGSRGANGVVIITTKSGKEGKAEFSVNVSHGMSQPTNTREWLNADQYIELFREAAVNSVGPIFGSEAGAIGYIEGIFDFLSAGTDWRNRAVNTDWQDLAFQDGYVSDADFSMSGGNSKTTFFFSGSMNETKGIIKGNNLRRFNGRTNIDHQFSDRFKVGMNLSFSRTNIDRIANDNAFVTPLQAIAQPQISPAYLEDGSPNPNTIYPNFLLQEENAFYETILRRVNGRTYGNFEILEGLKINSSFAYDLFYQTEDNWTGRNAPFQSTNGSVFASSVNAENYVVSNFLSYDKIFGDLHTINLVAGTELNETRRRFESVTANQFPSDDFQTVSGGAEVVSGEGTRTANSFFSLFARATYDYDGKYLLKASIRRDGASRFGANERYGTFPAFSAGWILSEEDFLSDSATLSFLKLRGSWGQTGNADIGNFSSRYLFGAISYNQRPGIALVQPGNPDLTWETTSQTDIGIEYGFFNNRISGEIDYYVKDTDGLLFNVPLVPSSGAGSISSNVGELRNEGVEFVLNTKNIQQENFVWNTSFNIAYNKNEILSLPNNNNDIVTGQNIQRVGEVINSIYVLEYAGVDPANGDGLYYKNTLNPDGTLNRETTTNPNEARRIVAGSPVPDWFGGLTNTVTYHDFDLSFTFQGEFGASIYNAGGRFQSASADFFDNQTLDQYTERWQNPGDITDVPQARLFQGNGTAQSTRYLDRSDFVRLRNATLGYSIPTSAIERYGLSTFRVYLTGVNLLTFTDYDTGFDPEARSDAGGIGQEFYSVPPARTISLGLNVKF